MPFITHEKTNWKFLLIVIILAVMVGIGALWVSKKEIPSIQIVLPKTQKEISEQKVLELENQILEPKFGSKITEFTIIKKITTPSLESCPGVKDYTQNKVWFSEGFPDIKGFRDYAIEGFIGINGEFICLYANRRGAGSGTPPLIPIDSFYDQVTTADWKIYSDPKAVFTFKYPTDWEIKTDYQYKSASCQVNLNCEGIHYIFLNKINDSRPPNLGEIEKFGIGINMPQCAGVKMDSFSGNNWICVFDNNSEIIGIYEKIKNSFQLIKDETADWKTYRNEEYGFEIKYPDTLDFTEEPGSLFTVSFPELDLRLKVERKPENFSDLEQYLTQVASEENNACKLDYGYASCICNVESQNFGDKKTLAIVNGATFGNGGAMGATRVDAYLENGDYFFVASYGYYSIFLNGSQENLDALAEYNTIQQILSTFKFIDKFCGTSTNGSCVVNSDCIAGGCSGQLCQSKNDELLGTTCEWKACYRAKDYGFNCKCANNKCQWAE